ncbi:rhomboid family intramembrane serine protease [Acidimicrobiia bacterium EGI L10123]|uniref:rhomboid family intramembrane serine protease n=1 Tax=Salinilacustrithrix flava TaxID=2957203 RepID=UPI003D7C33EB|nr:rhomboid family intramembrane serine protease [Acidimicrobiia bacterium EGI L10123]
MTTEVQTCYRHTDRRAGVRCQRCERPICPSCMNQASVGFHCPECVKGAGQKVITARTLPSSANPVVTTALVAMNVAIYVVSSLGAGLTEPSFQVQLDFALIGQGLSSEGLLGVAEGEWYRLISGGFLHGSLLHLGFNMYVLWILGKQLEPALGRVGFTAVYFASMLAGSLGVMVLDPGALTVGASGAVFGLFGYAVVAQFVRGINPLQTGLGAVILINLAFTFLVPGISIGGHVGGLLGGLAAGVLHDIVRRKLGAPPQVGIALVAALGVACAVGSVLVL